MSYANEIGNSQNPFAAENTAALGAAQALTQSDVRMDKVSVLQQAIANGTYHVSASDVADKIIRSLLV